MQMQMQVRCLHDFALRPPSHNHGRTSSFLFTCVYLAGHAVHRSFAFPPFVYMSYPSISYRRLRCNRASREGTPTGLSSMLMWCSKQCSLSSTTGLTAFCSKAVHCRGYSRYAEETISTTERPLERWTCCGAAYHP
jgi:hypothetical protein